MQRQSTEGKVLVMAGAIPGVVGSDRVYLSDDVGNLLLAPFYDAAEIILGRLLTGANMRKGRQCIVDLLNLLPGMRLLEVSPGPGVFEPGLRQRLGKDAEIAAVDSSLNRSMSVVAEDGERSMNAT